ncbi:MAG: biotin--[acetyl-CoA-carboxylase] ligase [Tenericutes bacterium HGW-Tenericutes-5]|nr:MAG: biotin--[acetyl-CoA-carboxylase] ligase [Tenericutes bacterium HGW-Tenericutes-5]
MTIGKNILKFDILDSTNNYLKERIDNLIDGTICYALEQTNGRGRRENTWKSPKGNLYFSFFKNQQISREEVFFETIKTSVAIIKLLDNYQINASVKYPNDILVNSKKIAGILIETTGVKLIDSLVIGVGLNVNQSDFKDLNKKAISIALLKNQNFKTEELLKEFIKIYNSLNELDYIYKEYLNRSLIIGKEIRYENQKYQIAGIFLNGDILIKNEKTQSRILANNFDFQYLYND